MQPRIVDEDIALVPYYPNFEVSFPWYQDLDVCKQVDNIDHAYSLETLKAMYEFLSTHGDCFYIQYQGNLVGDIALRDNQEVCIVICKEYQNKHIGRRAIRNMLELAREKGYPQVKANIYSFNGQSRAMFQAIGFRQVEEEWFVYDLEEGL